MISSVQSRWPIWVGTAFMLSGLGIICVGTGVIPVDPASMRAPGWVIALCGAVFVLAGLTAFVEIVGARFVDPLAVAFILSFATVAAWVAFGGGGDSFYGSVSLGPAESRNGIRELVSRGIFGVGALTLAALGAGIFFRWLEELRSTPHRRGRRSPAPQPTQRDVGVATVPPRVMTAESEADEEQGGVLV